MQGRCHRSAVLLGAAAFCLVLPGCLVSGHSDSSVNGTYVGPSTFNQVEVGTTTEEWVLALDGIFPTRSRAEWGARFDKAGIIWAPVATLTEVVESEQVREMGWIAEVTHPDHGPYRTLNTPFRIHGSETGARGAAPRAGEHTSDVLAGMGIDAEQIAALAATGVFG